MKKRMKETVIGYFYSGSRLRYYSASSYRIIRKADKRKAESGETESGKTEKQRNGEMEKWLSSKTVKL